MAEMAFPQAGLEVIRLRIAIELHIIRMAHIL